MTISEDRIVFMTLVGRNICPNDGHFQDYFSSMKMRNKKYDIDSLSKELQQLHIREVEIKERINAIATASC